MGGAGGVLSLSWVRSVHSLKSRLGLEWFVLLQLERRQGGTV